MQGEKSLLQSKTSPAVDHYYMNYKILAIANSKSKAKIHIVLLEDLMSMEKRQKGKRGIARMQTAITVLVQACLEITPTTKMTVPLDLDQGKTSLCVPGKEGEAWWNCKRRKDDTRGKRGVARDTADVQRQRQIVGDVEDKYIWPNTRKVDET